MKIKNILYTIFSVLVFSSCNYLDITPAGKVIPETVTDFRALITSAYSTVPTYKYLLSLRSDELYPLKDGEAYSTFIDFALWNDNSSTNTISYPWSTFYKTIFYANTVIEDVMEAEINTTEDSREQLMAEALLLRAYMHFELVNLYAKPYNASTAAAERGIPLATKVDIEQHYTPATVKKVYERILEDIEEARKLIEVEKQPEAVKYRFSKETAMALEARVRLYRAEWELALNLAEELLPTCLLEDLNASEESPYEKSSREMMMNLGAIGESRDIMDLYILPEYLDKYKTGDLRVGKYFEETGDFRKLIKGTETLKVSFRTSEIYFIAAEAAAHLDGKLETAKTHLKSFIETRLTPEYYTRKAAEIDGMNQQQLLEEIMDERAREFIIEGQRWFDLRRTTQPEITKPSSKEGATVTLGVDGVGYVIPYPREATENNPDLRN